MRCDPLVDEESGVQVGFACSRGRRQGSCVGCGQSASLLCDGMTERLTFGSTPRTCDAWICRACTTKGAGGVDLCPRCASPEGAAINRAVLAR